MDATLTFRWYLAHQVKCCPMVRRYAIRTYASIVDLTSLLLSCYGVIIRWRKYYHLRHHQYSGQTNDVEERLIGLGMVSRSSTHSITHSISPHVVWLVHILFSMINRHGMILSVCLWPWPRLVHFWWLMILPRMTQSLADWISSFATPPLYVTRSIHIDRLAYRNMSSDCSPSIPWILLYLSTDHLEYCLHGCSTRRSLWWSR